MNNYRMLYGWRFALTIVLPLFLASLGIGLLTVDLVSRVSDGANTEDRDRTRQIVHSALEAAQQQFANMATDNSQWDDAVRNTYGVLDEDWLFDTWGVGTVEAINYDVIFVIDRQMPEPVLGFTKGKNFSPNINQYFSGKLGPLLDLLPEGVTTHASKSTIINTRDGLAIVAAAPILPTSSDLAVPNNRARYLLLLKFLTPKYLGQIGEQYVIPDLEIAAVADTANTSGETIRDATNADVATVQWSDRRPGDTARAAVFKKAAIVLGFLVLVLIGISILCWRMIRAVGEAVKAEAEANESSAMFKELNHNVTLLNIELETKVNQLKEAEEENLRKGKLAQLGVLIATVAHELRNPLGSVRTTAFVLGKKLKDCSIDVAPQLARIETGIMRCDNIILQLLDFARSQKPQTTAIDVDSLVEHTLNEEATKLPAKLTITCDLGLQGSKAYVDGERTTRAIINLVYNAAEAMMNNGEPRPEMGGRVPNINVSTHLTARGTEIIITDNGPGISSEVLEKIREPLFTTKGFGTGLGIPAVEKIMELHGGGLEISSVLGEGSRFTIWFPATRQNQQAA